VCRSAIPLLRVPFVMFFEGGDQPDFLVQAEEESFYITAMGCEDGFGPQGLQAAGAGGL
jgi:hypothetical protein